MPKPAIIALQVLWGLLMTLALFALSQASPDPVSYLLDEPVFNGQSYIIEAGRNNKEMIVLVHGLGDAAADTWERFVPELAKKYHVVCFDLPGFGRSTKTNALYSPDNYVAFIDYVVSKLGKQQFMLVGHSLGGNVALRYATSHPHKVKRLMLVDVAGVLHRVTYTSFLTHFGVKLLPQFYPQQSSDMKSLTNLLIGQIAAQNGLFERGEKMLLNDPKMRQTILGGDPTTIAAYAMIMTDYARRLHGLKVPTLILWGKQDQVTPIRTGKVLATQLANAGLVVFDQTGHSPMHEKPERFADWLLRFSASNDDEFNTLLDTTRYRIDNNLVNDSQRIVHCKNQNDQLYVGDFKFIILENCQNVEIDSARIQSLTIKNSQVTINNCVINSDGKAVLIQDASVQMNGCIISGSPALSIRNAELDIAGSELLSTTGAAVQNLSTEHAPAKTLPLPGPLAKIQQYETILFSISYSSSKFMDKYLHGPVNIAPGQAW